MKKLFLLPFLALSLAFGVTLKVGSSGDYIPLTITDEQGGLYGFDIDLITELSKRLKFDIQIQKIPYEEICQKINAGELDLGISAFGVDDHTTSCEHSVPYFRSELLFIKLHNRADITSKFDLVSKKIAYEKDATQTAALIKDLNATSRPIKSENILSGLFLLQEKKVDVLILDSINKGILTDGYQFLDHIEKKLLEERKALGFTLDGMEVFHKERGKDSETFLIYPKDGRLTNIQAMIDAEISKMLSDGTIAKMLEKYGL